MRQKCAWTASFDENAIMVKVYHALKNPPCFSTIEENVGNWEVIAISKKNGSVATGL